MRKWLVIHAKKLVLVFGLIGIAVGFQNCGKGFVLSDVTDGEFASAADLVFDGKATFAANCASCHNGPGLNSPGKSSKADKTAVDITTAINTIPDMRANPALQKLNAAQITAIANYLRTTPAAGEACLPSFKPERVPARLLSNTEYDNIAIDVFGSKRTVSSDAKFTVLAPGSSGFTNTAVNAETASPTITDVMAERYFTASGLIADEVIAAKSQAGSFYKTNAACALNVSAVPDSCYDSIIRTVGLKLWRRPVSEAASNNEFARLKAIFKSANFDIGFHDFLRALLMSPNFLVIAEAPSAPVAAGSTFVLNDYQLATRLAFFLWQSTPDDTLLSLAQSGSLSSAANMQTQVVRMLKDPKAKRIASLMTSEWLGVRNLFNIGITSIDNNTLNDMMAETQYSFEDIISSDTSFLNTVAQDYTFINRNLANYYGVDFTGANDSHFFKTSLASTPRRGIINQGAFLVSTAGGTEKTHPVLRGKYLARKVSCYDIAPPPPNIDTSLPQNLPSDATPAEVLEVHTKNPVCASCHTTLDAFGLPLESYNSRGIWRNNYLELNNRAIDASGKLPSGESFANTQQFMTLMGTSPIVRNCLVRRVMSVGVARKIASADDQCNARDISQTSMTEKSKFSDLIFNIVSSRQFRVQTTEAP